MNRIFEVLGENKKYIEFCHTARARPPRARGPCNMARQLVKQHRTARLGHFEPRCLLGYQDLAHAVCD